MIEFGGIRIADIFICAAMYISNAKSKLPIVRKRRSTHAIVMAVVNWKQYLCVPSYKSVQDHRGFFLCPLTTSKGKEQRVYHPSSVRVPCFHYTYIHAQKVALHEGAKGAGVAPRRATMPVCTDARMCRVLHAFFTLLHMYAYIYTHARTHACRYTRTQAYAHTVSDLPSVHRDVSLLCNPRVIFYIIIEKRMFDIFVFWCMRNITTWEIYRDKMHRFFCMRFRRRCIIFCVFI